MREQDADRRQQPRRPGMLGRIAGRREPLPRNDSDRIAAVAAHADMPVEDVLREVADFRLALETDMIIAAAAVDADSPDLLSEVVDGERLELATFHDRLLERLADAAADDEIAVRRERRRPSRTARISRTAAVAAAFVAVLGVGRATVFAPPTTNAAALETADQQYANFSSAVSSHSSTAVRQTAQQLHVTLEELIKGHASDPEVARRTAQMLQAEISLLQINDPTGASQVIAQAQGLVKLLTAAAPPQVRASVAPVLNAAVTPSPKPKATASPKASPTPTASPSSTKTTSSSAPDNDPLHTP
jgi:hypothetical protein